MAGQWATHPIIGTRTIGNLPAINWCTTCEAAAIEVAAANRHCGHRKVTNASRATAAELDLSRAHGHFDRSDERGRQWSGAEAGRSSETTSRIVAGTLVSGDIDVRTLGAALEALPRPPERIVVVDNEALPLAREKQWRDLDAFVPVGSRVIYLRRQSLTLLAAESGRAVPADAGRRHLARDGAYRRPRRAARTGAGRGPVETIRATRHRRQRCRADAIWTNSGGAVSANE